MLISSSPIINNNFNILKTKNLNSQGKSVSTPPKNPTLNQAGANISFCAGYKGLNTLSECRNTARALGIKVFDVHDLEIAQVILGGFKNMRNKLKRTDIFPEIVELYKDGADPQTMSTVMIGTNNITMEPMITLGLNREFFKALPSRNAQKVIDVENLISVGGSTQRTFVPNKLISKLKSPQNPQMTPLEHEMEKAAILETIINNTLLLKKETLYAIDRALAHKTIAPDVAIEEYTAAIKSDDGENLINALLGIYKRNFWDKNVDVPLYVVEQDKNSIINRAITQYNAECANIKLFSSSAEREEEYLEDFSATFAALPFAPVYRNNLKNTLGYSFDAQLKGANLPDDLKNLFHNNGISHLLVPDVASK